METPHPDKSPNKSTAPSDVQQNVARCLKALDQGVEAELDRIYPRTSKGDPLFHAVIYNHQGDQVGPNYPLGSSTPGTWRFDPRLPQRVCAS